MPRLTRKLPSYRKHKASGNAVVALDGKDHYFGKHGTPESRAESERVIAEWLANRRTSAQRPPGATAWDSDSNDLTLSEVLDAFWRHAERHY